MKTPRHWQAALLACCLLWSCDPATPPTPTPSTYHVVGHQIQRDGEPFAPRGVNAMQTFGLTDPIPLNDWKVAIVREFIGNLREQPIAGGAIQGADGKWLHALERIVATHREHGRITILCPFGWVDEQGVQTLFTGLNPRQQPFYTDYVVQMQAIAAHFAGQPDVWLEVWNEPYHWDNANGYTHELWRDDMLALVALLRDVAGFDNIIVVPGCEQGQSEAALLAYGETLTTAYSDIVFDLHAYEKWHSQSTVQQAERLSALRQADLPILFGEVGVANAGHLLDATPFLNAVSLYEVPTLGWLWKEETADPNALRNDAGDPNTHQNFDWGRVFQAYLTH